jgi:hypothetical protein
VYLCSLNASLHRSHKPTPSPSAPRASPGASLETGAHIQRYAALTALIISATQHDTLTLTMRARSAEGGAPESATSAQLKEQLDAMIVDRNYWQAQCEEVTAVKEVLLVAVDGVREAVKGLSERNLRRPPQKQAKRLALTKSGTHTHTHTGARFYSDTSPDRVTGAGAAGKREKARPRLHNFTTSESYSTSSRRLGVSDTHPSPGEGPSGQGTPKRPRHAPERLAPSGGSPESDKETESDEAEAGKGQGNAKGKSKDRK